MIKEEILERLKAGEALDQILPLTDGQGCRIYKPDRDLRTGDDVVYIPDIDLHDLWRFTTDEANGWSAQQEEERIAENLYTGDDFLALCGGCLPLANSLYRYVDWQGPSAALAEYPNLFPDEEWKDSFGKTIEEIWPSPDDRP